MPVGGSCTFSHIDGYEASLQRVFDILVRRQWQFFASLTWVDLPKLRLLRAHETLPRVAHVSLTPAWAVVSFPVQRITLLVCDGRALQFGDIMFHSLGEQFHQRMNPETHWGCVYLRPISLRDSGVTIAGDDLVPPSCGIVLRPPAVDRQQLLRQYATACRIVESNLPRVRHPEVARSLEQEVTLALVNCLTNAEPVAVPGPVNDQADIIARVSRRPWLKAQAICSRCRRLRARSAYRNKG